MAGGPRCIPVMDEKQEGLTGAGPVWTYSAHKQNEQHVFFLYFSNQMSLLSDTV